MHWAMFINRIIIKIVENTVIMAIIYDVTRFAKSTLS